MESTQIKTKVRLEYQVQVFMDDTKEWESSCNYHTLSVAEEEMVTISELEEAPTRTEIYEVIEEDTLRCLSFGTLPVISRTLIGTLKLKEKAK